MRTYGQRKNDWNRARKMDMGDCGQRNRKKPSDKALKCTARQAAKREIAIACLLAVVAFFATACATCFYRQDNNGFYKKCGEVVKCTSPNKLPNKDCK